MREQAGEYFLFLVRLVFIGGDRLAVVLVAIWSTSLTWQWQTCRTSIQALSCEYDCVVPLPFDPVTGEIIAELISGSIGSVVGRLGKRAITMRREAAVKIATDVAGLESEHLAHRLNLAVAAEGILPPSSHAALRTFLRSSEMANSARQLCAAVFVGQEESYSAPITSGLAVSLVLDLKLDDKVAQNLARLLVETLVDGFKSAKSQVKGRSRLQDDAWRELFLAHLRNIDRMTECIASTRSTDLDDIHQFQIALRDQIRQRHRLIVPPNIGENRRVPIDQLYITPQFLPIESVRDADADLPGGLTSSKLQSIKQLADTVHRTVILGAPGAGKTTLVTKICYDLAGRSGALRIAGHQPVPIPIVLRDFAAVRKNRDISILDFIVAYARTRLQLDVPSTAFNYLLSTGGAIVLFDGLDELVDVNMRQQITADVESFCNWFSSTPVLVTSRLIGYREAPLDESVFTSWELADFSEYDVELYVRKWFSATSDMTPEKQESTTSAFLQESLHVRDLRSNPLMLALLCNIYRGEGYLPRYRPDVYERCSIMLLERWDRSRGIPSSFEAHMTTVLMSLAYWIYISDKHQDGVTESALIERATFYLHKRRFQHIEQAEAAAQDFVQYCRGRAWILTDVGTTASGESLYQFTHRTFLEYFTAAHLVRVYGAPERVWRELRAHVAVGAWDVVASLAVQLLNRHAEDGADRVFRRLLSDAARAGLDRRNNLLEFAARCLQFIVPSPEMTEAITDMIIASALNIYDYKYSKPVNAISLFIATETLAMSAAENIEIILDRIEAAVLKCRNSSQDLTIIVMMPLLSSLSVLRMVAFKVGRQERWVAAINALSLPWPDDIIDSYVQRGERIINELARGLITLDELYGETLDLASHWTNRQVSTPDASA